MLAHNWNGYEVQQREDGYVCLTDMARACDRRVGDYFKQQGVQDYIQALTEDLGALQLPVVTAVRGGSEGGGATWAHPEVAIDFAQWVSLPFRIWANRTLRNVIYMEHVKLQEQLTAMQNTIAQVESEKIKLKLHLGSANAYNEKLLAREKKKPLKLSYPQDFARNQGLKIVVEDYYHEHSEYTWYTPKNTTHQKDCFEKLLKKWLADPKQMQKWGIPTYTELWEKWQHKECFAEYEYSQWMYNIASSLKAPTLFLAEWTDEVFFDLFCADSGIPKRQAKLEMKDEKKFRSLLMYQ